MKMYLQLLLLGAFLLCHFPGFNQTRTNAPFAVTRHNLSESAYVNLYADLKRKGYKIEQVSGFTVGGRLRISALWRKSTGPDVATFHKMTSTDFNTKANSYKNQGYKMTWVSAYSLGGRDYYTAVWKKKSGPAQAIRHRMNSQKYNDEYFEWKRKGFRLVLLDGYNRNGQANFVAIWERGTNANLRTHHFMSSSDYQNKVNQYKSQGFELRHISAYAINNQDYYAAIWDKRRNKGVASRHRLTSSNYGIEFDNHYYAGYSLRTVSGYRRNGKAHFAAIWEANKIHGQDLTKIEQKINRFMQRHNIPGLQIAIGKDERLVYAQGFGRADQGNNVYMGPDHKMRIASISKIITAAGIMRLAEKRVDFSLNNRVFGPGRVLGMTYNNGSYSNFEKQIRIINLLEHTAAGNNWDNNTFLDHIGSTASESPRTGDPMLTNDSRSSDRLISDFLKKSSSTPDVAPGMYYAYSNFGYLLLGKAIEAKSGVPYATWIRNNILKPSGANGMFISKTKREDKRPNEAVYYGNSSSDNPYSRYNIERMGAHGGWAASVIDLSKINVRIDGNPRKKDIISSNSFNSMMTQGSYSTTPAPIFRSGSRCKGWQVWDSGSFFHGGSLPGTFSKIKNMANGYFYVIIINSNPRTDVFRSQFDILGDDVIRLLEEWPSHDLF